MAIFTIETVVVQCMTCSKNFEDEEFTYEDEALKDALSGDGYLAFSGWKCEPNDENPSDPDIFCNLCADGDSDD